MAFYAKRHGEKLLYEKWQPNKAIKVLCQLEPHADQSYSFSMAPQTEPGKPGTEFAKLGKHEALGASWITKNYNELGSFLHLQAKSQSQTTSVTVIEPQFAVLLGVVRHGLILSKHRLMFPDRSASASRSQNGRPRGCCERPQLT